MYYYLSNNTNLKMNSDDLITYVYEIEKLLSCMIEKIRKNTGLSGLDVKVINQIHLNNNTCSASFLAKKNHVTIAAMMHSLYDLEEAGFLVKTTNELDNRQKFYTLTEKGLVTSKIIAKEFKNRITKYLDSLGEDQVALARILQKTIIFLEEKNA